MTGRKQSSKFFPLPVIARWFHGGDIVPILFQSAGNLNRLDPTSGGKRSVIFPIFENWALTKRRLPGESLSVGNALWPA